MNKYLLLITLNCLVSLSILKVTESCSGHNQPELIKILILSGRNNHEWQKTTPALVRMFKDSKLFLPQVTDRPDTLKYDDLKKFDLIVSNWNSFPDSNFRMSNDWESGFLRYVKEGGGVLSFHAGSTSFYKWEDYHQIGIGRWGEKTSHGIPAIGRVSGLNQDHPVTRGLKEFNIMDEIWEDTEIHPGAVAIGWVSSKDAEDGHPINEPAIFYSQTGKGRTFFIVLGHDERALLNSGLQTLLLRAAQWCAGKKVTVGLTPELSVLKDNVNDQYGWDETDSSFALKNHSATVWQLNYNNRYGKPYFHPVTVNNIILTCVDPPDHPWHLGLWFSWKYINGINYWEYLNNYKSPETGFKSEGITEVESREISRNPDFSASVKMKIKYHPVNGEAVLAEERNMNLSAPFNDGSYYIDEEHIFRPLKDSVILDRTPIAGEPGGQSWGGYAGLSVRFSQNFTSPEILVPSDSMPCPKCDWLYMGFKSLTGEKAGIAILQSPGYSTGSTSWYLIVDPTTPFWYFSPGILFDHKIILRKGESLHLKYRIWMLSGILSKERLQQKSDQFK